MEDRGYGWTIEMQIKASVAGLRIVEIPVPYRRRIGRSKISGTWNGSFRAGWRILATIVRYGFPRSARRAPPKVEPAVIPSLGSVRGSVPGRGGRGADGPTGSTP